MTEVPITVVVNQEWLSGMSPHLLPSLLASSIQMEMGKGVQWVWSGQCGASPFFVKVEFASK